MNSASPSSSIITSPRSREKPAPRTLRDLRHAADLTLVECAEAAVIASPRLSDIERGERLPTSSELEALEVVVGAELRVVAMVVEDSP